MDNDGNDVASSILLVINILKNENRGTSFSNNF
jgi:hypothetical protein